MYHLLTAVSDSRAFPLRRHAPSGTDYNMARLVPFESSASASATAHAERGDSSGDAAGLGRLDTGYTPTLCCGLLVLALLVGGGATGVAHSQGLTRSPSRADKIANALTAGPEELTRNAAVEDWPAKEGEGLTLLRQGSNGWTCLPDDPTTTGNDPMCLDATFHDAVVAFFSGGRPNVTKVGWAYMLTSDAEGSNTDPMAQKAAPGNEWHHAGPHVMVIYPDAKMLEGVPTKPTAFGPYVMFSGTPIAHVMLPVTSGYARAGLHSERAANDRKRP